MNGTLLATAVERFEQLAAEHAAACPDGRIAAYICHSRRTRALLRCIADGCDEETVLRGEVCALFHDTGRFGQIAAFATTDDRRSLDHAAASSRIAAEQLAFLGDDCLSAIRQAIEAHGAASLARELKGGQRRLCSLVRDADRMDILATVATELGRPKHERDPHVLPPVRSGGYNASVLTAFARGRLVQAADVFTETDLRLYYLSWVFELEDGAALKLAAERGDMGRIALGLGEGRAAEAVENVNRQILDRCGVIPFLRS